MKIEECFECTCGGQLEETTSNNYQCQKCENTTWISPTILEDRMGVIDVVKMHLIPSKTIYYTTLTAEKITPFYSRYRLFKTPPFNLTIYRGGIARTIYNWFGLIKITIIK